MVRTLFVSAACAFLLQSAQFTDKRISEVVGAPASLMLETRAGELYDSGKLQHDVQTLWRSGRVSDVQVEAAPEGDAVRVIFHLKPKTTTRVRKVHVDPPTPGVRVEIEPGTELDAREMHQIVAGVEQQLVSSGYEDPKVEARLAPAGSGKADLELHIDRQRSVDVANVTVSGNLGVSPAEVHHALRATRTRTIVPGMPGLWKGWRLTPAYNSAAVQSDLASLRSLYYRRGYFDADVQFESVDFAAGKAHVTYYVEAGPRYRVSKVNGVPLPGGSVNPGDAVCGQLFAERRDAERTGVIDFSPRLEIRGSGPEVEASMDVTRGPAYTVGRIEFLGNRHVHDKTLRRMLLVDEGAPLDQLLLRKSMARINQTGWFEPLTDQRVVVNTPPGSSIANINILLKEKKFRSWSLSGPVGPLSLTAPLRFAIGSRLPPWGQDLLELSTYTVSLNLLLFAKPVAALIPFFPNRRFLALVEIQRPPLPGQGLLSGFAIAPQLGWQAILAGYGLSQTRNLLGGLLQSDRGFTPDLLVTISHNDHQGTMRCEPPGAGLDRMRQVAGVALNLTLALAPL